MFALTILRHIKINDFTAVELKEVRLFEQTIIQYQHPLEISDLLRPKKNYSCLRFPDRSEKNFFFTFFFQNLFLSSSFIEIKE